MNQVILSGRLTADPVIRQTQSGKKVASYTLAVDRPTRAGENRQADFIRCQAWEKSADFAEKYMMKGRKYLINGRIQTGNYQDKDGRTVYTTDVIVNGQEFADSKPDTQAKAAPQPDDGFIDIPDDLDEELPFR